MIDHTGNQWVTAFGEEAEILLNSSAKELGELKQRNNEDYLKKIASAAFKTFMFKIRFRFEPYKVNIFFK